MATNTTTLPQDDYQQTLVDYNDATATAAATAKQDVLRQAWESDQQAYNAQNATVANNYQSATNAINLQRQTQLPKYQAQKDATSSDAAATQRRTEALNSMGGAYNSGANRSQMLGIDLNRQSALQGIQSDQNNFDTSTGNALTEADSARVAALNDIAGKLALGTTQYNDGALALRTQLESDKQTGALKAVLDAQARADEQYQFNTTTGLQQQQINNQVAQYASTLAQENEQFRITSNMTQQQINNQVSQFRQGLEQNASQFGVTSAQTQQQIDSQVSQYATSLAQSNSQFERTAGQSDTQIDNQASQFERTAGQADTQITNQANQNAAQLAQNAAQFAVASAQTQQQIDDAASQFAESFGLSKEQLAAQIAQNGFSNTMTALNYNASVDQTEFNNGIAVYGATGVYGGDVSSGTDRAVVNPDGTVSVVPVDVADPVIETPETDVLDKSGNIALDLNGTTTDKAGVQWKNYKVVGPDEVAPSKNAAGAKLVGYRLYYKSHGDKYYIPMYSDQIGYGTLPKGYKKSRDINGMPTYVEK